MQNERFVLIENIPSNFRVADLRAFFSDHIERKLVTLFHFVRRPDTSHAKRLAEEDKSSQDDDDDDDDDDDSDDSDGSDDNGNNARCKKEHAQLQKSHAHTPSTKAGKQTVKSYCGIAKVRQYKEFIRKYNAQPWKNENGETLNTVCIIIPIKDPSQLERDNPGNVKSSSKSSLGTYLPELHPPPGLPQGNVGTPRAVIREAIRKCLLPASALKEMGVRGEPAPPPERIFGEVKMRYAAHVASDDDDDGSAEEWERHEALHEDDEPEEYLYENEVEVTWDKGGSGLVFYTDAVYWDALRGDFHERTSDDFDITDEIRYSRKLTDSEHTELKDSRYLTSINRDVIEAPPIEPYGKIIGEFERHTKGVASRIMRKMGWKGKGLGACQNGKMHPLQLPANPSTCGLGYKGPVRTELDEFGGGDTGKIRIGTIYDPIVDDNAYTTSRPHLLVKRRKLNDGGSIISSARSLLSTFVPSGEILYSTDADET